MIDSAGLWVIVHFSLVSVRGDTPPHRGTRLADHDSTKTAGSDKRKQSLYFPEAMLQEIKDEAGLWIAVGAKGLASLVASSFSV